MPKQCQNEDEKPSLKENFYLLCSILNGSPVGVMLIPCLVGCFLTSFCPLCSHINTKFLFHFKEVVA